MNEVKKATIVFLAFMMFVSLVYSTPFLLTIPQTGLVVDEGLSASPSSIDWGNLTRGENVFQYCNITNTGNVPLTLNMTYDPDPVIDSLTWDFEGQTLDYGLTQEVRFNMTTKTDAPLGSFSFNIYINGES